MTRKRKYLTPRRRSPSREQIKTLLIATEGKTEKSYFNGLKRDSSVAPSLRVTVQDMGGGSAKDVIEKAKSYATTMRTFDEVWCVLDADKSGGRNLAALERIAKLGRKPMKLIFSNPCFEVWVLLHFVTGSRSYHHCDEVRRRVSREWKKRFDQKYDKSARDIFEKLASLTNTAISNARGIMVNGGTLQPALKHNSSSEVYQLVERLRQQ